MLTGFFKRFTVCAPSKDARFRRDWESPASRDSFCNENGKKWSLLLVQDENGQKWSPLLNFLATPNLWSKLASEWWVMRDSRETFFDSLLGGLGSSARLGRMQPQVSCCVVAIRCKTVPDRLNLFWNHHANSHWEIEGRFRKRVVLANSTARKPWSANRELRVWRRRGCREGCQEQPEKGA